MDRLKNILTKLFIHNWSLKLVSFVFAAALWMYVSIGQTILEVPKQVSLELKNLPMELVRVSDIPARIDIKVSGSSAQLRGMENDRLSYELDLSNVMAGNLSFKIISTRIKGIPTGVRVTEISPSEISIKFSERIQKALPVEVVTRGKPAKNYAVEEKSADPPLVKVSGAREEVENLSSVYTEIIDIGGFRESYEGVHALDLTGRHIELVDEKEVRVKINITRDLVQREFTGVEVTVEKTDHEWSVDPRKINLRLKGPSETLRDLTSELIKVVVDAEGLDPGTHMVKPQVVVPGQKDVVLVGLDLPEVRLVLKKAKSSKK